jgi:hypothetical protein
MSWAWDCEKTHAGVTEIPAAVKDRYSNDAQTGREGPLQSLSLSRIAMDLPLTSIERLTSKLNSGIWWGARWSGTLGEKNVEAP